VVRGQDVAQAVLAVAVVALPHVEGAAARGGDP
jgi:hypothetical protein